MNGPKVYILFPKTGLGNMLLVWAKGAVFASLNNLPYTTSSWWGLHWGALVRRERKKRLYLGYFTETALWKQLLMKLDIKKNAAEHNPSIEIITGIKNNQKKNYIFDTVLTDTDVFGPIRDHREIVIAELNKILADKMKIRLAEYGTPLIGIHIRRGDFKIGNQTTPLEYFIKGIETIRATVGKCLPVTVFTDADAHELAALLLLPAITIADNKPDILDILLLSKSKVMILSKSSTFGYWAAFLSDAIIIRPATDWQQVIRHSNTGSNYQEIKWQENDDFLTQNLITKITTISL